MVLSTRLYRVLISALLILAILLAIIFWYICPIYKPFPKPTGSYEIGTMAMELKDSSRKEIFSANLDDTRDLMVRFWYPAPLPLPSSKKYMYLEDEISYIAPGLAQNLHVPEYLAKKMHNSPTHAYSNVPFSPKQDTYPVILFSPGFGRSSSEYVTILENLASHGYIIVGINHSYFGPTVLPSGKVLSTQDLGARLLKMKPLEKEQFTTKILETYIADMKFVIDQLEKLNQDPKSVFHNHLDLNRIGILGHSDRYAASIEFCRVDNRCKAVVNLDGWYSNIIERDPLKQPLLLIFGSKNINIEKPSPEYLKRKNLTAEQFEEITNKLCTTPNCSIVKIPGASQQDFSDTVLLKWPYRGWNQPNGYNIIALINNQILKFFNTYLKK